jgi:hypothetical protein
MAGWCGVTMAGQGHQVGADFISALWPGDPDCPGAGTGRRGARATGDGFPASSATHEADEAELVDLIPQFAPTAAVQQRLLVDNPARLYGFSA